MKGIGMILMALMAGLTVMVSAEPVRAALQPGTPAPAVTLEEPGGEPFVLDRATSGPVLLVFLKPGDKYAPTALESLTGIFQQHPELEEGLLRAVVFSRLRGEKPVEELAGQVPPGWKTLLDPHDEAYHAYKIIATPTVTILSANRIVAAVHAGYDAGMANHVRKELAEVLGVELPGAVYSKPERPNMKLQLARRLIDRGLYDRALPYYEEAAAEGPLAPRYRLDLAEIYLEMNRLGEAEAILDAVDPAQVDTARLRSLREKLVEAKSRETTPQAPLVHR